MAKSGEYFGGEYIDVEDGLINQYEQTLGKTYDYQERIAISDLHPVSDQMLVGMACNIVLENDQMEALKTILEFRALKSDEQEYKDLLYGAIECINKRRKLIVEARTLFQN